ncbi:TolC family protein [Stieleria sp. TO1_6]|uniref:TolC family protein n=1 Tax=Stieleria tagensis TaxID=2956795 RepID=UPI00209A6B4B|nr:TolC family protein [Stieleria tagensis]MCO8122961.1 TolC family protein [Stieleria tagensis]
MCAVLPASAAVAQQPPQPQSSEPVEQRDDKSFAAFLAEVQSEEVEPGQAERQSSPADPDSPAASETNELGDTLTLADVVASLYRSYPEIEQSRQLQTIAAGDLTSAYGAYDTKFQAESLSEPLGFYKTYRNGLAVARQTWWGGYVSAGYRIGRGDYQPWYKGRQTDDAGEFKLGVAQPLLRGRAIDPQRVAVFQASLQQQAAAPRVRQSILDISRQGIDLYWQWVAAGATLQAQRELLELAEKRGEQYRVGVTAGKFAEIDLILNQQLIAERRAALLKADQKFRATGFKLGLYLRDDQGQPMPPQIDWLPMQFPKIESQPRLDLATELAGAIARRPETELLRLEYRSVDWDRRLARNDTLPRIDFVTEASQDMGAPATKADDKGEFELVIGFRSEVPIQRRKARGKIQSTSAKLVQINEKLRLTRNKIATDIQVQSNRLELAFQIVNQTEAALTAAIETLQRYRFAFDTGKIDLIYLNLLETKANESEIKLVDAQREWFSALAELQLALGLDPLDQAMIISMLPESNMPGPGKLPVPRRLDANQFETDWQRHRRNQP